MRCGFVCFFNKNLFCEYVIFAVTRNLLYLASGAFMWLMKMTTAVGRCVKIQPKKTPFHFEKLELDVDERSVLVLQVFPFLPRVVGAAACWSAVGVCLLLAVVCLNWHVFGSNQTAHL